MEVFLCVWTTHWAQMVNFLPYNVGSIVQLVEMRPKFSIPDLRSFVLLHSFCCFVLYHCYLMTRQLKGVCRDCQLTVRIIGLLLCFHGVMHISLLIKGFICSHQTTVFQHCCQQKVSNLLRKQFQITPRPHWNKGFVKILNLFENGWQWDLCYFCHPPLMLSFVM